MKKEYRRTANRHQQHVRDVIANIIAILLFLTVLYFTFS